MYEFIRLVTTAWYIVSKFSIIHLIQFRISIQLYVSLFQISGYQT